MNRFLLTCFLGYCATTMSGCAGKVDSAGGGDDSGTCEPGAWKTSGDEGCGSCTCQGDGTWNCTETGCLECTPGDTRTADDGCNSCSCQDDGTWACTLMDCAECSDGDSYSVSTATGCSTSMTCKNGTLVEGPYHCPNTCAAGGDKVLAPDLCNTCTCSDGQYVECTHENCEAAEEGNVRKAVDGYNICVFDGVETWECSQIEGDGGIVTPVNIQLVNDTGEPRYLDYSHSPLGFQGSWDTAIRCTSSEGERCHLFMPDCAMACDSCNGRCCSVNCDGGFMVWELLPKSTLTIPWSGLMGAMPTCGSSGPTCYTEFPVPPGRYTLSISVYPEMTACDNCFRSEEGSWSGRTGTGTPVDYTTTLTAGQTKDIVFRINQ